MSARDHSPQRITLAFTGASGMPYRLRLLECLLQADRVDFVVARILDQLHDPNALMPRWGRDRAAAPGGDAEC